MKVKRELISHLIDYGYIIEKTTTLLIIASFIIVLLTIPAWPTTISNYMKNPIRYGLPSLGLAILVSTLLLATGLTAFLLPYFEPILRPHGFRELRDKRMLTIYITLIAVTASITVLVYLLFSLTLIM
ncbi:MAG: hypothetical protein B6U89_00835 [Desulfurococcales archaeon ex4484_58]|nr:MAG: hypothetical protein B6U89_00835 [Desulfurococcales archaeon ex4484_58]